MSRSFRLADCGDLLTVREYSAWAIQSVSTTYHQIRDGNCLVPPFTLKPSVRWRRIDLEAKLLQRDLVPQQRKARVRARLASQEVTA